MTRQFQVMKKTSTTWEVFRIDATKTKLGYTTHIYELVSRIVLDTDKDRFFVERTTWLPKGHEFKREERPYIVLQAAVNAATTVKDPD